MCNVALVTFMTCVVDVTVTPSSTHVPTIGGDTRLQYVVYVSVAEFEFPELLWSKYVYVYVICPVAGHEESLIVLTVHSVVFSVLSFDAKNIF